MICERMVFYLEVQAEGPVAKSLNALAFMSCCCQANYHIAASYLCWDDARVDYNKNPSF